MTMTPIGSAGSTQSAFGLDFQSLLRIILTQLTYQDPLKPVDNFQFVSQLAQFSQLQQSQTLNDQVNDLLVAQAANQATSLLGRTVDFSVGPETRSGRVEAVSFSTGQPTVTIRTPDDQIISGLSITDVSNIRL
ncbi:flagellar hook assembly protein FlgD [Brevundimonas sp.]|jgi:flagellar basal-body rod modification protein FlgD|uniref:flagellar hook assembly protein FlgD n=1 Tax=Brevundimonas sp. TaxID=1871086 RepID=UPI002E150B30|nr:flagellar hook capping FlgD N-terminal domain-containing protein [Brevundimonas sp.]